MRVRTSPLRTQSVVRFALLGLLLTASCSSGLNPVRGKVTHKGQPIKGATVTFHPVGGDEVKATRPNGTTDADGSFTLSSEKGVGAAAGEYTVTIIWPKEVEPKNKSWSTDARPEIVDQLNGRYADHKQSKIRVRVKAETNNLEPFALE